MNRSGCVFIVPQRFPTDPFLQNMIPFAVVGSERNVIIDGKPVRGRKNRWGVINVEDEKHCEFVYLRNFLTRYDLFIISKVTERLNIGAEHTFKT